jgi:hypothetical protein
MKHLNILNTFVCGLNFSFTQRSTNSGFFVCLPQDRTSAKEEDFTKIDLASVIETLHKLVDEG